MHNHLRKAISWALCATLTLSLSTPALASFALGEDLSSQNTPLHTDTQLSENVFWSTTYSDLRTEQVVTYSPSKAVKPMVTYGGALSNRQTVSTAAAALEDDGYRVVAGINGDYFNLTNGLPVGLVITDGTVKSSDGTFPAIGFYEDGSAVLGRPDMRMQVDFGYTYADGLGTETPVTRQLDGVNRERSSAGGIYFYTYEFNDRHTTGNVEAGVDLLCTLEDDVVLNQPITMTVEAIYEGTTPPVMAENQAVLSVNAKASEYDISALRGCAVGNTITVTLSANEAWTEVDAALGALYSLVENGQVVSGLPSGAAPRTAVGQTEDGSLLFYTIDGRSPGYSIGATMKQVAERLIELGCVTVLGLDGGGSTTMAVSGPFDETAKVVNRPSDGSSRSVSTHLFLVSDQKPTGRLASLAVSPSASAVVAGSTIDLTVGGVDTHFYPMNTHYTLKTSAGTLHDDTLRTPNYDATVTVTATHSTSYGKTDIQVVESPDTLGIYRDSIALSALTIAPGESMNLTAHAWHNHLPLYSDNGAYTWELTGNIGVLDAAGQFVATNPGSGEITVTAGDTSVTMPVNVTHLALQTVEDFEGETTFARNNGGMTYAPNTNIQQVALGRSAGAFTYGVNGQGTASIAANYPVPRAYTQLNLLVYGDDSPNMLTLCTDQGNVDVTQLDFTGWEAYAVELPAGTSAITGLQITAAGELAVDELGDEYTVYLTPEGTLGIDQMVLSYGGLTDSETPVIDGNLTVSAPKAEAEPENPEEISTEEGETVENLEEVAAEIAMEPRTGALTATIADDVDGFVSATQVFVYLDGKETSSTYDVNTGKLTASFTFPDEAAHRVTVEAVDASGNRQRASWDVTAVSGTAVFDDTADHWAGAYVDFLKTAGVTNGYADNTFRPDQNINRQEFAVMLYRYLQVDGTQYESVALPFADLDSIDGFALTAVQSLYTLGIINGSTGADGQLYFSPHDSLTRAQASAMIGRTQPKGYDMVTLTFADGDTIPSYATDYVATMVALEILGGYTDGTFRPHVNITRGQMAKILYNSL